jgi:hypothetical protein
MKHTDYLEDLNELRQHLKCLLKTDLLKELVELAEQIDATYIESYCRIKENSEHGSNCGYAARAKDLFLKMHEPEMRKLITHIYKTYIEER